jgi:hypothetical protein
VGTVDPTGPLGEQKGHHVGDFLWCPKALEWEIALDELVEALGIRLSK